MIEKLASASGRNDEILNIKLAELLVQNTDVNGIAEIARGFQTGKPAIASDCIKVLYEIAQRKPALVVDYADLFIDGLARKDNRLVWGSMTALAHIAIEAAPTIYRRIAEIIAAYHDGSVITIDNCISLLAALCKANPTYHRELFPLLMNHLATCRAKELPQHAQRVSVCLDDKSAIEFKAIIEKRLNELSPAQLGRIKRLLKRYLVY